MLRLPKITVFIFRLPLSPVHIAQPAYSHSKLKMRYFLICNGMRGTLSRRKASHFGGKTAALPQRISPGRPWRIPSGTKPAGIEKEKQGLRAAARAAARAIYA
jgi:hypothetical protein